jgi:hypothetical protein
MPLVIAGLSLLLLVPISNTALAARSEISPIVVQRPINAAAIVGKSIASLESTGTVIKKAAQKPIITAQPKGKITPLT